MRSEFPTLENEFIVPMNVEYYFLPTLPPLPTALDYLSASADVSQLHSNFNLYDMAVAETSAPASLYNLATMSPISALDNPSLFDDNPEKYHLKLLIPSYAAGCIIGKGGQTIVQIQSETGSSIKISKANDVYPGTNERVMLVVGSAIALNTIAGFVAEKIRESVQLFGPRLTNEQPPPSERAKQAKLIVPNTTAGLIIGKGGVTIKMISGESGAKIIISQKSENISLPERVITITGEPSQIKEAVDHVVDKIQRDPQSSSCPNISYSSVIGPVANSDPTGSPFAPMELLALQQQQQQVQQIQQQNNPVLVSNGNLSNVAQDTSRNPLSDRDAAAISAAVNTLASYGFHVNMGGISPNNSAATTASPTSTLPSLGNLPAALLGSVNGQNLTSSLSPTEPSLLRMGQILDSLNSKDGLETVLPGLSALSGSKLGLGGIAAVAYTDALNACAELEVPENIVGAVLGKGGKTLVDIQNYSGARIQISKKGEYVPGTTNRKVTVSGLPNAVQLAQFLIRQRIAYTEESRAKKGPMDSMGLPGIPI